MNIQASTRAYEAWLAARIPVISKDLRAKHARMNENLFAFLRATFYRWIQLWPEVCSELADAPSVLAVGDLHVENFGTWRDAEGRLAWGVNDFDEACWLAYPNDLVRLAVSAHLATEENQLSCSKEDICKAILEGYTEGMQQEGRPFVLAERHSWLRQLAISDLRDPVNFWKKLDELPTVTSGVPNEVRTMLKRALPAPDLPFRVVHRQAGLGSLGRRRYTALAEWQGGLIAREAKELRVSALHWQEPALRAYKILYQQIVAQAIRIADPFVRISGHWLLRRLAPDCSRIPLVSLPKAKDEFNLLRAMGRETANVHLGTKTAHKRISRDLRKRPAKWLHHASIKMANVMRVDWKDWARK
jgi:hypothetical protein